MIAKLLLAVIVVIIWILLDSRMGAGTGRKTKLPPGPKGWPIIGNLLDMPKAQQWFTFSEWKKIYGGSAVNSAVRVHVLTTHYLRRHRWT